MNRFLVPLGFAAALVIAVALWWFMPEMIGPYGDQMKKAGFLVPALMMLLILQISFVVERLLSLKKAQGRGSLPDFLNNVRKRLHAGDVQGAIQLCGQQRGSAANVMRAGLERYTTLRAENAPKEKVVAETQAAIQEASGLETPPQLILETPPRPGEREGRLELALQLVQAGLVELAHAPGSGTAARSTFSARW